jgi:hypothetical protein
MLRISALVIGGYLKMSFDRDPKEFPHCETCQKVPDAGQLREIRGDDGKVIEHICHKCLEDRNKHEKEMGG